MLVILRGHLGPHVASFRYVLVVYLCEGSPTSPCFVFDHVAHYTMHHTMGNIIPVMSLEGSPPSSISVWSAWKCYRTNIIIMVGLVCRWIWGGSFYSTSIIPGRYGVRKGRRWNIRRKRPSAVVTAPIANDIIGRGVGQVMLSPAGRRGAQTRPRSPSIRRPWDGKLLIIVTRRSMSTSVMRTCQAFNTYLQYIPTF